MYRLLAHSAQDLAAAASSMSLKKGHSPPAPLNTMHNNSWQGNPRKGKESQGRVEDVPTTN